MYIIHSSLIIQCTIVIHYYPQSFQTQLRNVDGVNGFKLVNNNLYASISSQFAIITQFLLELFAVYEGRLFHLFFSNTVNYTIDFLNGFSSRILYSVLHPGMVYSRALVATLVKINPNSLHSEWKSSDILENPHLVRALSCQRSMVIHGQFSLLKSTLFLTCLKLHYTTNIGISLDRPEDSHAVSRMVRICWDLKKVQFNFVLLTGIYSDF